MKILFAFAHPDDEAFGPAGTIAKLSRQGHDVTIMAFCRGDRHGQDYMSTARLKAFQINCKLMGAGWIVENQDDFSLTEQNTIKQLQNAIDMLQPDVVYTHSIHDLHCDHKVVAQAALVACRPGLGSKIKSLYMCEIPAASDWTFGTGSFQPNTYVDVTEFIDIKTQVLSNYPAELYRHPDPRSIQGMITLAQYRGQQISSDYAEAFQLVFSHDRKTQ